MISVFTESLTIESSSLFKNLNLQAETTGQFLSSFLEYNIRKPYTAATVTYLEQFTMQDSTVQGAYSGAGGPFLSIQRNGGTTDPLPTEIQVIFQDLVFNTLHSGASGGAITMDLDTIRASMTNIQFGNVSATNNGGVIDLTSGVYFKASQVAVNAFTADVEGNFFHLSTTSTNDFTLEVDNSVFTCKSSSAGYSNTPTAKDTGSVFYFNLQSGTPLISFVGNTNTYTNCFTAEYGGVFHLET